MGKDVSAVSRQRRAEHARRRALAHLADRAWKIAVFALIIGPLVALMSAGPNAAGLTDTHAAQSVLVATAALSIAGEALSFLYFLIKRVLGR
ncbi:MAG: hypothetical protein ACYDEH_11060 [Acidimicrobiales bacterium]